eukprot:1823940-Amphidinium_carterae.1
MDCHASSSWLYAQSFDVADCDWLRIQLNCSNLNNPPRSKYNKTDHKTIPCVAHGGANSDTSCS